MALELRQSLKLSQQLVMTPQLQQAIKLLQLSRLELADTITQEVEQNPILEDDTPSLNSDLAPGPDQAPAPDQAKKEQQSDHTSEVDLGKTSESEMPEINWSDYVNEYESASSYNPRGSNNEETGSRLDILAEKPNLLSHLNWQLSFIETLEEEDEILEAILGNLNQNGFLEAELSEIAEQTGYSLEEVEDTLELLQGLEPAGVGARNVQECLLLQLKRLNLSDALPSEIVKNHLNHLETKNYIAIAKATRHKIDDVVAAINIIIDLDPHPGQAYSNEEPQYITPDVTVQKIDGEYVILQNNDGLPRLRISAYYKAVLQDKKSTPPETREYIQDKMRSAAWLIKSIEQRQRTIYKVVESLIKFQYDFFEKGVAYLKPLVLRDVAEDIEMHESTVSRVTSNKYVHTPQGTFELKYFFNSAIERKGGGDALSSESIRQRLKQIVAKENPDKPLSDLAISKLFADENIKLARRTVAKYREQLGILPSKYRKKPKLK